MSMSRRIGLVRARHARSTARLWWVAAALLAASAAASTGITAANLEPTLPTVTTLPAVGTQPPSSSGRSPPPTFLPSTTAPAGTPGPPAPGLPGAQGPPGPPGAPGLVVVLPAPTTTGPPPTTVLATATTMRCRVPSSTMNPSPTHPCLPH